MVSALMTAKKATEIYEFPSLRVHGNSVELKNTDGVPVVVAADQLVYMRGRGNFGIYGDLRDEHRKSQGYDPSSRVGKIGVGTHRHEQDLHGRSSQGRQRKQDRGIFD